MENIIINFTADPAGLQPGIDGLVQMEVVDRDLAEQVKKTGTEITKRDKAIKDGTTQSANGMEKLATATKNLDKSIVGGAYTKALKDIQKQVDLTADEFKVLSSSIELAKKKQQDFKPDTEEWKQLQQQIQAAEDVLKAFGEEQERTETKTKSMKARLREMKEELSQMETAGQDGSEAFQKLAIEAAQLEDQIGDTAERIRVMASDTANIDAAVEGITMVATGFQLAEGAMALFGDENEDMQKALVKLNAIMAITSSLQQVQNFLTGQSILKLKVENALKSIGVLQTNLQTSAESKNVVVKYASIAAQRTLNAVMAASPAGMVLTVIGAIAGALLYFTRNTESAADEQRKFNERLKEELEYLDQLDQRLTEPFDDRIKKTEQEISLMNARGASTDAILKKERELAVIQTEKASFSKGFLGTELEGLENINKELSQQENNLKRLQHESETTRRTGGFFSGLFTIDREKEDIEKDISSVKAKIDALTKQKEIGERVKDDASNAESEVAQKNAEIAKKAQEDSFKSARAFADSKVLIAKEGSRQELNARIAAIGAAQREELANVNLTEGERARIIANSQKQIRDLQFDFDKKALEDAKRGIDAKVVLAQEGSRQELDLKLQQLEAGKVIELKDKELTDNKKLEIEARYQKQREDLVKAYNQKVAEDAISARIAELNSQNASLEISADAATHEQLLNNKKQLIDEQAALEVIGIQESEKNEELRRARIQAVYSKALADKKQLEKAKAQAEIDEDLKETNSIYDQEIANAQRVINSNKATFKQKRQAQEDYFQLVEDKIDAERLANEQLYESENRSYAEYIQKKRELDTAYLDNKAQQEQASEASSRQIREQAIQASFALMQQVSDAMFAADAQKRQAELDDKLQKLGQQRDAELSIKGLTEDQKDQINKKYAEKERALKRKNFEEEKKAKKQQALMNGFLAVTNILATRPKFDFGIGDAIMIAAALASTALQVVAINNTQPPQFRRGKVRIQGPGTDTSDSILARISRNESVINAAQTKKHEAALRAINEDRFHSYLAQHELPKLYSNLSMPQMPQYVQNITNHGEETRIDYEKLGDVIAQKLAENPSYTLSFDERGFTLSVQKQNEVTEFVNKKLSL